MEFQKNPRKKMPEVPADYVGHSKECCTCHKSWPTELDGFFGPDNSRDDQLKPRCRDCERINQRSHQKQHQAAARRRRKNGSKNMGDSMVIHDGDEKAMDRLVDAIASVKHTTETPHCAEILEGLWKRYGKDRFEKLYANHLEKCEDSNSLVAVQKAIDSVVRMTAEHRTVSLGDLSNLSEEDIRRELRSLVKAPQIATDTLPDDLEAPEIDAAGPDSEAPSSAAESA
jgi:hypothetical protein